MARTQAADYDQRREAILDRAAALFSEKGFRGASVADLARACDTSKSLIYHYYPSKEDILYGVMASHVEALVDAVEGLEASSADPVAGLRVLIATFLELYVGAADRQKVLLNELAHLPPDRRRAIVAKQRRVTAAVSELLARIQPGLARDPRRLSACTMLVFGMINWTMTWFHAGAGLSTEALAKLATDMMLGGVEGLQG